MEITKEDLALISDASDYETMTLSIGKVQIVSNETSCTDCIFDKVLNCKLEILETDKSENCFDVCNSNKFIHITD